ncbi:hypothetical protein HMPREF2826_00545 [Olsenella sp. HMSC062G07]|nr:hypothetical protein HMPREF2826_00545 [Olsenella sp. HMSC062G07]
MYEQGLFFTRIYEVAGGKFCLLDLTFAQDPEILNLALKLIVGPNLIGAFSAIGITHNDTIFPKTSENNKMTSLGKITLTHDANNGIACFEVCLNTFLLQGNLGHI